MIAIPLLLAACQSPAPQLRAPSDEGPPDESVAINTVSGQPSSNTTIVPTLDAPITEGMNAIWCATAPLLWKHIEQEVTHGPIQFDGATPPSALLLNAAPDPEADLPPGSYVVEAGPVAEGLNQQIAAALAERFPGHTPPHFDSDFAGYAYLKAEAEFTVPFERELGPVHLQDADGQEREIQYFSTIEDPSNDADARKQVRVLYHEWTRYHTVKNAIVELDHSKDKDRVILAQIPAAGSLAEMVHTVQTRIHQAPISLGKRLKKKESLRAPLIQFNLQRTYPDLSKATLQSPPLTGMRITEALQTIDFSLDEAGAKVESDLTVLASFGVEENPPRSFFFQPPFLLMMQRRDASMPYLVIYVADTELLMPWQKTPSEAAGD